MPFKIGEVEALFRYPVKSMGGEPMDAADLGWHGLDGDRRLAFRRIDDRGGSPWLTATRLPELMLFAPRRQGTVVDASLPTHVRTPDGLALAVFSQELATDVGHRCGFPVEMMHLNRGIFDQASVSLISVATVGEIGRLAAPDRVQGGVQDWVQVGDFQMDQEEPSTIRFSLTVAGEPSGNATLTFGEEGTPTVRHQRVVFPEGVMEVEERYSSFVVRS